MSVRIDSARIPQLLREHLEEWFGGWNPLMSGLRVVASENRELPGWDGVVVPMVGVVSGDWGVLSVAPHLLSAAKSALSGVHPEHAAKRLALFEATYRWCVAATEGNDVGAWVNRLDMRVPEWLRPFNGDDVLIAWDDAGAYGAGAGRKIHNQVGHEISVGTEPALRGRGLAQALVATMTRRILAEGAVATYMHVPDNAASARVADAVGFLDYGWRYIASPENRCFPWE
jgi:GNAT superfamily N-acetyltransferase